MAVLMTSKENNSPRNVVCGVMMNFPFYVLKICASMFKKDV